MATSIDGLKSHLRITHDEDDDALDDVLRAAESDALRFCDLDGLPDDPAVDMAVYMIARSMFDSTTPADAEAWRNAARLILWPHRGRLGA